MGDEPDSGWPPELTQPAYATAAEAIAALASIGPMMDSIAIVGNAYFNAIRRVMALSTERAQTVDDILKMIGSGKVTFLLSEDRIEFLGLTRKMLEQLRRDEEIVSDLSKITGDTADQALRKGGGKAHG